MKNKILHSVLLSGLFVSAILLWFAVHRAITVENASAWTAPIECFLLFFIFVCLCALLIKDTLQLELVIMASLGASLFFAPSVMQVVIVLAALLILSAGVKKIRRDLELNVKIDVIKSLRIGKASLIFGLALLITSQYYFTIQNTEGVRYLPKFQIGANGASYMTRMLAAFDPQFASLSNESMTVDDFILNSQKTALEDQSQTGFESAAQQQLENKLILEEGRKQLSEMTGKSITGRENMSEVVANLINQRMSNLVAPQMTGDQQTSPFPIVLSVVLLLTIVPLGSFFGLIGIYIVKYIFQSFASRNVVTIRKIPVEMEVIE